MAEKTMELPTEAVKKNVKSPSEVYAEIKDKVLIGKRRRVQLPQWAVAWLVLIPALVFLALFMFYPIINAFFMAFINDFEIVHKGGSFALGSFFRAFSNPCMKPFPDAPICKDSQRMNTFMAFGFTNFQKLFKDPDFVPSILNTAILVIVEVPLTIMVSLLIATFMNHIKPLRGLYQTIFFLPYVTNSIALGLVFNILFASSSGGIVNMIIVRLGGSPVNFLSSGRPDFEMPDKSIITLDPASKFSQGIVIVTSSLWNGLAFKILVFMAGLATIDKQYTDAAKIDGASGFTIWRRITLPLLSPQILYITITSFIGAFKMYSGVISVYSKGAYYFGGASGKDWMPVVGWIYKQMGRESENAAMLGVPAAGSLVLLGIILIITVVQFAVSKKRVHY